MGEIYNANSNQRTAGVAVSISSKINCNIKVIRNKEKYFIMIKGPIHNIYLYIHICIIYICINYINYKHIDT